MRILLDTNIYIAAALGSEFIDEIIKIFINSPDLILLTSEEILSELQHKLKSKFNWQIADINIYIEKIRKIANVVEVTGKLNIIQRDVADNKVLECAVAGKANLIVSADKDLIDLKSFQNILIIHPRTLAWTFPEYFKKDSE